MNISSTTDIWVPFGAAILGGVLSLAGAFFATWQANKSARRFREEEMEQSGAEQAYATLFKLMDGYNSASILKKRIDEMFTEANRQGKQGFEPWAKVMTMVGDKGAIVRIQPNETSFLISAKRVELLNEVHEIQWRISSLLVSVEKFNEARASMEEFLKGNLSSGQLEEGNKLSIELEGEAGLRADMEQRQLNSLIEQIVESLEEVVPDSWRILGEFKEAAQERYGNKFPKFEIKSLAT